MLEVNEVPPYHSIPYDHDVPGGGRVMRVEQKPHDGLVMAVRRITHYEVSMRDTWQVLYYTQRLG